ncbi:glycerol uptake facilitator protein [Nocardioides luteus]|uniref:Aquaporin n=1 Tax=Nocardioides luteus TaxID=1844 RepID=A0ABQ5SPB8_9ACTN|nr:MIP/aquaporin family protein [Nocardioides luteus]MDR7312919.1 glycerol uptake facilitator protein [Nocardioides luteus]GGR45365.1 aquaporin [Nocardioides luteus]GLJ65980.1 aquaporin [Nocardioides luteus]
MTEQTASGSGSASRRTLVGELSAEFAGTMILILFGVGVVAQVTTGDGGLGDHDSIAWAWGIGVMLGIYTAGRISGAHLNPAVSLAMAVFSDFEWRKVLPYSVAQILGAFVGALLVRVAYADAIASVDPGHTHATQGIFSTLPGNGDAALGVSLTTAFADQVIGTAILLFLIMAITDARNSAPIAWFSPVAIAFVIVGIGMAWGTNAGYAINPARDFGPRLASFVTGYDGAWVTAAGDLYFWIPILGPLLGGLVGAGAYKMLISRFLPAEEEGEEVGTIPESTAETSETAEPERKSA